MKKTILLQLLLFALLCIYSSGAYAYRVYVHTGDEVTDQLLNKSDWFFVSNNMDGFYVGTPGFRELTSSQQQILKSHAAVVEHCIVESPFEHITNPNHNIMAAINAGLGVNVIMVYNDWLRGSTLLPWMIGDVKAAYQYKELLVNIRYWAPYDPIGYKEDDPNGPDVVPDHLEGLLTGLNQEQLLLRSDVAGFTFEFNPVIAKDVPDPDFIDFPELVNAIEWGVSKGKRVILLTPPFDANDKNDKFLKAHQDLHEYIENNVAVNIFNSWLWAFVPANYEHTIGKASGLSLTPEDGGLNLNDTTTEVAKWLIQHK